MGGGSSSTEALLKQGPFQLLALPSVGYSSQNHGLKGKLGIQTSNLCYRHVKNKNVIQVDHYALEFLEVIKCLHLVGQI